jgi:hypothetical protein
VNVDETDGVSDETRDHENVQIEETDDQTKADQTTETLFPLLLGI